MCRGVIKGCACACRNLKMLGPRSHENKAARALTCNSSRAHKGARERIFECKLLHHFFRWAVLSRWEAFWFSGKRVSRLHAGRFYLHGEFRNSAVLGYESTRAKRSSRYGKRKKKRKRKPHFLCDHARRSAKAPQAHDIPAKRVVRSDCIVSNSRSHLHGIGIQIGVNAASTRRNVRVIRAEEWKWTANGAGAR